jgi:plastocyanin
MEYPRHRKRSPMRKPFALLVALALVAMAAIAVPAFAAKTVSIGVLDNEFSKSSLTIKKGTKVHWAWNTTNEHNIFSEKRPKGAKKVRSGSIKTTGDYTYTFKTPGKYRIICQNHPFDMVTKIKVKAPS